MPYIVQWRRRRNWRRRALLDPALLFAFLGLSLIFGIFEQSAECPAGARIIRTVPESYSFADYTVPVKKEPIAERTVYPYSVVRGGVRDREELLRQIRLDPVVAEHYIDFKASNARMVRVRDEKRVYVSYRIDDKVFWTRNKINLSRGEALISDGIKMARARCGNRISVVAQQPTSIDEPKPEVFDIPSVVVPIDALVTETVPEKPAPLFAELRDPLTFTLPDPQLSGGTFSAEEFLPINPPEDFRPPVIFVEPELSEVPEPGTLYLVATTLAAYFVLRRPIRDKSRAARSRQTDLIRP